MNGKRAKKLRRRAESLTVQWPDKNYEIERHGSKYTVRLTNCTRSVYQKLKRASS